jgi:hypothetical protein
MTQLPDHYRTSPGKYDSKALPVTINSLCGSTIPAPEEKFRSGDFHANSQILSVLLQSAVQQYGRRQSMLEMLPVEDHGGKEYAPLGV